MRATITHHTHPPIPAHIAQSVHSVCVHVQGAGGPLMRDTITRIAAALSKGEEGAVERALRASFLVGVVRRLHGGCQATKNS